MLDRTELIPVADGERRRIGPFDCPVHPGHALGAARLRDRVLHARGHDHAHAATSSSTSRRSTAATPTSRCSARSRAATAASGCCCPTRRTRSARASRRRSRRSAPRCASLFREHPDKRVHRHELRVAPAPRAAGRAGRDRQRPQGRVRRPVDAAERHAGPRDGASSTSRADRVIDIEEAPQLRAGRGVHHLHRFAGRADERAVADGRARAQAREDRDRRRRRDLRARDPRQRVERVARDRLAAPRRRRGRARPQRRRCTCRVTRRRRS